MLKTDRKSAITQIKQKRAILINMASAKSDCSVYWVEILCWSSFAHCDTFKHYTYEGLKEMTVMKWLVRMLKVGRIAGRGGLSRALILSRGVSLHRKHWRLMFGLQTYNFPAKNASSSKVTGSHIKRERERGREWVSVQMCLCASTHVHVHWDYRKFTECKTEIYKAKPAESIISCTTTLTSQMTIFGLGAARPHVLVSGLSVPSYIFWVSAIEHLVGIWSCSKFAKEEEEANA